MPSKTTKVPALNLEVETLEQQCTPGCTTSTTHKLCTCPVSSTAGYLFTAKATR